jgi:hypothetical protein
VAFKIDTQQFVQSLLDIGEDLAAADNSSRNRAGQASDSGAFEVRFAGDNVRFNLERRVAAAARVVGQAVGLVAFNAPAAQIDEGKVEEVLWRARGFGGSTALAYAPSDLLNEAERGEVTRRIAGLGEEGTRILTTYAFQEPRNITYDDQQAIARAVAGAYGAVPSPTPS